MKRFRPSLLSTMGGWKMTSQSIQTNSLSDRFQRQKKKPNERNRDPFQHDAQLLPWSAISDLLLCGCIHLFGRKQWCSPEAGYCARIHGQRHRSDGNVVRSIDDTDEIRIAKCEVERLEPGSSLLHQGLSNLTAFGPTVFANTFCTLSCVTALNQILRHGTPPSLKLDSESIPLFPAFHSLAVLRFRGELRKLNTHAIQIGNVRQNRFGGADASLADVGSPLFEHRCDLRHVLHVNPKMIHSQRTPIRRLQFDERILADLNVDQRHVSLLVNAPESFGKS